ncbi:hypothetical protein DFJ73DRAFT_628048, partial [Zopfochytrium polystomum]
VRSLRRRELNTYRSKLSIWSSPFTIVRYFSVYVYNWLKDAISSLLGNRALMASILAVVGVVISAYSIDGPLKTKLRGAEAIILWYGWWVLLGIASSIGLGTGLHTFVLFLGPHVAKVTLTAYICNGLDFEDRGAQSFVCHSTPTGPPPSVFEIYDKVKYAVFFWGLGTSIGELPPYFIARAAAIAGRDDPDFVSIERILEKRPENRAFSERMQVMMYMVMQNLGFFGILLCASVPNPLFDLAGIICGHFSVPFIKFWGATFIGKAMIKNTLQSFSLVILFSEGVLDGILTALRNRIPILHDLAQTALNGQLRQFANPSAVSDEPSSIFSIIWNMIIAGMVGYFALSLVEALAIQELRRQHEIEIINLKSDSDEPAEPSPESSLVESVAEVSPLILET